MAELRGPNITELMARATTEWPGPARGVEVPKAYILWINYYTEGWRPHDCDSLEDCYKTALSYSATDFTITGPAINVIFSEGNQS